MFELHKKFRLFGHYFVWIAFISDTSSRPSNRLPENNEIKPRGLKKMGKNC